MTTLIATDESSILTSKAVKRHLAAQPKPFPVAGSRYPQSDNKIILRCANGLSFSIEDSGTRFTPKNATSKRIITYTDTLTGATYRLVAKAWEIRGGARIQTALSINDVFKGSNLYLKHRSDNAAFNMCASTEKAVLYGANHAESLIVAMAMRDRAKFHTECNAWLDTVAV